MSVEFSAPAAAPVPPDILIVDDSAMMRTLVKRVVGVVGLPVGTIYEAGNGREALSVLYKHDVQVVFTDLNMPVMTGSELLRAMLARDEWQHIVRVVISTDGSQARRAEVDALNVKWYVEKPFRPEVMRDVLSDLAPATAGR